MMIFHISTIAQVTTLIRIYDEKDSEIHPTISEKKNAGSPTDYQPSKTDKEEGCIG